MVRPLTCDIAVIGCGPAGATAAYLLASWGLDVLVLEAESLPRNKLCGGLLTLKTMQMLEGLFGNAETKLRQSGALLNVVSDYELCFRKVTLCRGNSSWPFWFVRRDLYDLFLATAARQAGARIREADKVLSIDHAARDLHLQSGRTVRYRYLIGADGANSVTRRSLRFSRAILKRWRSNLAVAMECFVPNSDLPDYAGRPIVSFGYANQGYCWSFPHGQDSALGIGGLPAANADSLVTIFHDYLADLGVDRDRVKITGHPVPYGYPLSSPGKESCLLTGDAAGFVDPLYGEGVFFAHLSAALAAKAICQALAAGTDPLPAYVRGVRSRILPYLHRRLRDRGLLFGGLESLGYWPLKAFLVFGRGLLVRHVHGTYDHHKEFLI